MDEGRKVDLEHGDEALVARAEAELARWLAVEPSPAFKAGVRRRIAEAPPWAGPLRGWAWLAATAVAAAIAAALALRGPTTPPPVPVATSGGRAAAPAPRPRPAPPSTAKAAARDPGPARARRASGPAVLVPAGEASRVAAYYAAMSGVQVASVPAPDDELEIAPLEITPLPGPSGGAPGHGEPHGEEER